MAATARTHDAASPSNAAIGSAGSVADITSRRSSALQDRLDIEAQGKSEIRLEAALVKLVKQDGAHAFQGGIMLQDRCEYAFRHDLDARRSAGAALEPHSIADGLPRQVR